jgi:hypothetical protein
MSHLLLRAGGLFHFHHGIAVWTDRAAAPGVCIPVGGDGRRDVARGDDLAFFSLSLREQAVDPRVELGRLALLRIEDAVEKGPGKTWPDDWWM